MKDEQIEKINAHLEKYGPSPCAVCGGDGWTLYPNLTALCAQQKNGVNLFKALQVVQLICEQCGHVVSFASDKIGVAVDIDRKGN